MHDPQKMPGPAAQQIPNKSFDRIFHPPHHRVLNLEHTNKENITS